MERYDNKVILQGKIIAVNAKKDEKDPKVASIVIETTVSRDGKKRNRIMAMCFDGMARVAVKYKAGDFVRITGNMQAHRTENANGKKITAQNVVVNGIDAAESRIEAEYGIKGSGLYDKINEVHIMGIVTGISDRGKDMKCIGIRTMRGGNVSHLILKAYVRPSNKEILESIKRGDNICTIGTIQTNARKSRLAEGLQQAGGLPGKPKNRFKPGSEGDGHTNEGRNRPASGTMYFENLIAMEISILDKEKQTSGLLETAISGQS